MKKDYCIVYSLHEEETTGLILPSAFIAERENNELAYMKKRALPEVIESFGIHYKETPHEKLLQICGDLEVAHLEEKFNYGSKRIKPLSILYKDEKLKKLIKQHIDNKTNIFYTILQKEQYPICWQVERKVVLETIRIQYAKNDLKPLLSFKKVVSGIEYTLSLSNGENEWTPCEKEIYILSNQPGWVVVNYELFRLKSINGNKLLPFLKKEVVSIPGRFAKTYFEKFVIDIISKVEVKTEGFDIIKFDNILSAHLSLSKDFINDGYLLNVIFKYKDVSFNYGEPSRQRSKLIFGDNEEITVHQSIRNEKEENHFINLLLQSGLILTNSKRFTSKEASEQLKMVYWLIKESKRLQGLGFTISPHVDDRVLALKKNKLLVKTDEGSDWFDIKGEVSVGDFSFPFSYLFENIRNKDPYYQLPDKTYFVIPDEWMTEYYTIALHGTKQESAIRISKSQYTLLEPLDTQNSTKLVISEGDIDYKPSKLLKATLRPYQTEGVKWLLRHYKNELGACLADDMGLGKTLQTIATLIYAKEQMEEPSEESTFSGQLSLFDPVPDENSTFLCALIVLPASLVFNWQQELHKFAPHLTVKNHTGPKRKEKGDVLQNYDVILTTYHTALKDIEILKKQTFSYLILDESQQIKNKNSMIFKAINELQADHKISLSGTPIENSLSDLWSQMQFINPDILGSFNFFKKHYKIPIEKYQDEAALDDLKQIISPFILRRTKEQVAKDLPELTEQIYYSVMTDEQKKLFETEKSAARNFLLRLGETDKTYKFHVLQSLQKLRQIANHPILTDEEYPGASGKFNDVTAFMETIIKAKHKVLVFSSFKINLALYEQWCDENDIPYCLLTGDTSTKKRKEIVLKFQEDPSVQVFFISIKAGGVGLNLTAASYVIILDPWWNPFVEKQAIARAHRIGQHKNVIVTRFISKDSIEEKIIRLQKKKLRISDEVIDIGNLPDLDQKEISELLS